MRFLLLILSLFLHFNASGYNINSPQENHANKILTAENEDFNERSCILFRFQGQYEDGETGLYYNRFRYYDPDSGNYISQDPISIAGGLNIYAYVHDPNSWIDPKGLAGQISFIGDALHPATIKPDNPGGTYKIQATGSYRDDKKALYGAAGIKDGFSLDYDAHHVSYDAKTNEMTMQLVKKEHHKVSHEGGVKEYENATGKKYKKPKTGCKS